MSGAQASAPLPPAPAPAFVVHDLRQALAAAEAAAILDRTIVLVTPASGLAVQGPLFWAEVQDRTAEVAGERAVLLADAGEAPGLALGALRCGLRHLIFDGPEAVATKLQAIVTAAGGGLLRRRPSAEDLLHAPDPASAVAARLRLGAVGKAPRQR